MYVSLTCLTVIGVLSARLSCGDVMLIVIFSLGSRSIKLSLNCAPKIGISIKTSLASLLLLSVTLYSPSAYFILVLISVSGSSSLLGQ